jgi:predicted nucleic acid-binding protein
LTIYADSSFFASHYLQDAHSTEVDRRLVTHPGLWMTPFHKTETAHAIFLHVFHKKISHVDARRLWSFVEQDYDAGLWIPSVLPEQAWTKAIDLIRRHGPTLGVRTLDSLHVACALELGADRFWTFDERQARLAEAVGLNTTS